LGGVQSGVTTWGSGLLRGGGEKKRQYRQSVGGNQRKVKILVVTKFLKRSNKRGGAESVVSGG